MNQITARLPFTRHSLHIDDTGTMYIIDTPGGMSIQWYHSTGIIVLQYSSTNVTGARTRGLCGNPALPTLALPDRYHVFGFFLRRPNWCGGLTAALWPSPRLLRREPGG